MVVCVPVLSTCTVSYNFFDHQNNVKNKHVPVLNLRGIRYHVKSSTTPLDESHREALKLCEKQEKQLSLASQLSF